MKKRNLSFEGLSLTLPPVGEKLGIETLSELVKFAAKVKQKIMDWKEDGVYSFWEKVGTFALVGKLLPLAADAKMIAAEIKDLDEEELDTLIALAINELGFEMDAANEFITEYITEFLFAIAALAGVVDKS